jgi:FtsP/CotA-like multicopper oxidase with cupredoxin domain
VQLLQLPLILLSLSGATPAAAPVPPIIANDNRHAAGRMLDGVLRLNLRAQIGEWRPERDRGPALRVEAFGEEDSALMVPAPLIRMPQGTDIAASVRNDLGRLLRVHGLCERSGQPCVPLDVPAGETREVRFKSGQPGTYHYWATTTGMPLPFRAVGDTQLSGAYVVDPSGATPGSDRVLVVTDWTSLTLEQLQQVARADDPGETFLGLNPQFTFLINGLSWPHTERLTYHVGDSVRWRVINLSTQAHTMHLHGFYYDVDSVGDGTRDTAFAVPRQRVVTQLMPAGGTLAMTWTPEREGNWLYHCHIRDHVSPERRLERTSSTHANHHAHDTSAGMAGMIVGVTVLGRPDTDAATDDRRYSGARRMTLEMREEPKRFGDRSALGFVLVDDQGGQAAGVSVAVPGPVLILKRGEPVEIALLNRLPEPTAIHWHGMELDSYYDGVHGFSGIGQRVTPLIQPGESFVVGFTPPRTGTFMYHTHLHDDTQLKSGLYGAMLVLDDNETYDPALDHVIVMGRGVGDPSPVLLNGQGAPRLVWKAGTRHRIRLINITPNDIFNVVLQTSEGPVTWRPLTKDGAPLPPSRCQPGFATQVIGVGETYDFDYEAPPGRRNLWLEVRSPGGKWQNQAHVIVR